MTKKKKYRIRSFISCVTDVGSGLIGIMTLGFYRPSWTLSYLFWSLNREHNGK